MPISDASEHDPATSDEPVSLPQRLLNQPATWIAAGGILLWLSFPPIGLSLLGWLAPVPWLVLAHQKRLTAKRPWRQIWFASWATWLALLYYIPVPHWMLFFGWLAMSAYLCCYVPAMIVLTRVAVHTLRIPLVIAAPITWMGTEYLRSFLFGGFAMSLLAHTQVDFPAVIQVADIAGGYGLSAIMIGVAASLTTFLVSSLGLASMRYSTIKPLIRNIVQTTDMDQASNRTQSTNRTLRSLIIQPIIAASLVAIVLVYGNFRLGQPTESKDAEPLKVALIQGSIDTTFPDTEEEADRIKDQTIQQYFNLTAQAKDAHADLDLIVWPEGKFRLGPDTIPPADFASWKAEERRRLERHLRNFQDGAFEVMHGRSHALTTFRDDSPLFVAGCSTVNFERNRAYNSAVVFDRQGRIADRYYKNHLVMFGEFVPFGQQLTFLHSLTPIGDGINAGNSPLNIEVNEWNLAPSICFESTVPHLVRRHVRQLKEDGTNPDILLNVSDDGWFYGTAALDHHLACNTFRAVEMRRPVLVAANTGFSAIVDSNGVPQQLGPRRETDILVAEIAPIRRHSIYERIGDWPAIFCLGLSILIGIVGFHFRRKALTSPEE